MGATKPLKEGSGVVDRTRQRTHENTLTPSIEESEEILFAWRRAYDRLLKNFFSVSAAAVVELSEVGRPWDGSFPGFFFLP